MKFAKNQGVWQILAVWQVQESIADVVWPLVALVIPSFSSASGTVHCSKVACSASDIDLARPQQIHLHSSWGKAAPCIACVLPSFAVYQCQLVVTSGIWLHAQSVWQPECEFEPRESCVCVIHLNRCKTCTFVCGPLVDVILLDNFNLQGFSQSD